MLLATVALLTFTAAAAVARPLWVGMVGTIVVHEDGNEIVLLEESEETYQQGLRYVEFIGPIVKAIQELAARVETLEGG